MIALASVDTRYGFGPQFLVGAAQLARRARALEADFVAGTSAEDAVRAEHLALVLGAVVQACCALEAEINELIEYGPGHALGASGVDEQARQFLTPLIDLLDAGSTLDRYVAVLHLLRRQPLEKGRGAYQNADLLFALRNELVHARSRLGVDMARKKLFTRLEALRLGGPPFQAQQANFFPLRCMLAQLAAWAIRSAVNLLDDFYQQLGTPNPLDAHRDRLSPIG